MYGFFFKQKAADEKEAHDWRSDVCSSDLQLELGHISVFSNTEKKKNNKYNDQVKKVSYGF